MNEKINEIETLAIKYCEGTATPYEIEEVEAWMNESEDNYQHVKQLYMLFLASDTRRIADTLDTEKALSDLHRKMQGRERNFLFSLQQGWNMFQRWAAILFIPITVSLLVLLSQRGMVEDIPMITMSTNPGMTAMFRLPDSTLVYLNSGSTLVYPARFDGETRNVTLKGEAYFEVTPNSNSRFILSIPDKTKVEVLGTKFNVEAYDDIEEISTTLLEGRIHFLYLKDGKKSYVNLQPCEKVVYNKISDSPKVVKTSCLSELAWKDGKVVFDNTTFKDALNLLERRFNVKFIVKDDNFWTYRFTGTFVTQQLKQILMNFQISSNIRWRYLRESPENNEKSIIELY